MILAAGIVAVLAGVRFSVEGRRLDLLLCGGFFVAALSTFAFGIAPSFGGEVVDRGEAWAGMCAKLLATVLIAAAPFVRGRITRRRARSALVDGRPRLRALAIWFFARGLGDSLPAMERGEDQPVGVIVVLALQALLSLVAVVGFGLRFRREGEDLDRWLALAASLALFAELHYVFTPVVSNEYVSQGDFLRLLSYGVLLAGVWRAIRFAEFGRAVAEERARVAREIHDGLAQYLFAISTHASMLENGAPPEGTLQRLKEAAAAAQQEARFAILALSSASGTAPVRRRAPPLRRLPHRRRRARSRARCRSRALARAGRADRGLPDRPGGAGERSQARARPAGRCAHRRSGTHRVVIVRDDGEGFARDDHEAGQGLKNLRSRAASIGGALALRSSPGRGTALEVTLRA